MGTYAEYRIWAGVTMEQVDNAELYDHPFISEIREPDNDDIEKAGLKFSQIAMHGEEVGIGVVIQELSWEDKIKPINLFDPAIATKAVETLAKVNQVFKDLGLPLTAKLYHHIDLGG